MEVRVLFPTQARGLQSSNSAFWQKDLLGQVLSAAHGYVTLTFSSFFCYSKDMKVRSICALFALLILCLQFPSTIHASSQQAYQDYLYQFDQYRIKNNEFQVAKNEFLKFKTLNSESTALTKTRAMISQRDQLLRAYLLLLTEKLNEVPELPPSYKYLYQSLLNSEITFLEAQSKLAESIGSIDDATNVSKQLESHYAILHASIRQAIIGISLGRLGYLSKRYDTALADSQALVNINRGNFIPSKQDTLDRWVLRISNTRSLYQQKIDAIQAASGAFKGADIRDQDKSFSLIQAQIAEARQYLQQGSSFMRELLIALKFTDL